MCGAVVENSNFYTAEHEHDWTGVKGCKHTWTVAIYSRIQRKDLVEQASCKTRSCQDPKPTTSSYMEIKFSSSLSSSLLLLLLRTRFFFLPFRSYLRSWSSSCRIEIYEKSKTITFYFPMCLERLSGRTLVPFLHTNDSILPLYFPSPRCPDTNKFNAIVSFLFYTNI